MMQCMSESDAASKLIKVKKVKKVKKVAFFERPSKSYAALNC